MNEPSKTQTNKRITIAITGASGIVYALRLMDCLLHQNYDLYVIISKAGRLVMATENQKYYTKQLKLSAKPKQMANYLADFFSINANRINVFSEDDWMAPIASGSSSKFPMVIVPCTMGALSAIASGASDNLIERAADVVLKERGHLILVTRETPYSVIHLKNMLSVTTSGGVILPANPGFYHEVKSINDLVDFVVAKVLDQLDISHQLIRKWGD